MLIWEKSSKIFEKWMNKTLKLKDKGEKKGLEALRKFAKDLGNGAYGQTIKKDHNENIQFINSIKEKTYLDENVLNEIIFNDDSEDAYHVFIGSKISDETKDLTSRSRF